MVSLHNSEFFQGNLLSILSEKYASVVHFDSDSGVLSGRKNDPKYQFSTEEIHVFRQRLIKEFELLSGKLNHVNFHRKLVLWCSHFTSRYPMLFTINLDGHPLTLQIKLQNPWQRKQHHAFWLQHLKDNFSEHAKPFHNINLSVFNRIKEKLFANPCGTVLNNYQIKKHRAELLVAHTKLLEQINIKKNLRKSVKDILRCFADKELKSNMHILNLPPEMIGWERDEWTSKQIAIENFRNASTISEKLQQFAVANPILLYRNDLPPLGDEQSKTYFFKVPTPGRIGVMTDEINTYLTLVHQAADELEVLLDHANLSVNEKLTALSDMTGSIFGITIFDPIHQTGRTIAYHPKTRDEILSFNSFAIEHYRNKIFHSELAEIHLQISLEESVAAFEKLLKNRNGQTAQQIVERERRRVYRRVNNWDKLKFWLKSIKNKKGVEIGEAVWSEEEVMAYILTKDILSYLNYLSVKAKQLFFIE